MKMDTLTIKGNNKIPTVEFKPDGSMLLEGKAIPEEPERLFGPINEWIDKAEFPEVEFTIRLIYFNTTVSKHLALMFKRMVDNPKIEKIKVLWFYEEGDDDCYDSGLMYKDKFEEIEFEFFVFQ